MSGSGASTSASTGRTRVAVVIGSGSVKCAAALGLFKVLSRVHPDRHGRRLQRRGPLRRLHRPRLRRADRGAQDPRALDEGDHEEAQHLALLSAMLPKVFGFDERFGLVDDRIVMERLRAGFGEARVEDARIPLYLTATDFFTGEQVVFSRGSVVDAVRASIAIPYVFQPWKIGDRTSRRRLPVGSHAHRCRDPGRRRRHHHDGLRESVLDSHLERDALRVPALLDHLEQPPQGELRVPQPRAPPRNPADHSAVRAQDSSLRYGTDSLRHREGERAAEKQIPYLRQLLGAAPQNA